MQGLCPNLCNGLRGRALQVPKLQQQGADRQGLPEDRDLCAAKGLFLENLVKMKKKTKCKNKYSSQKRKKIEYKYSENFSGRRMGVARKLWFLQLPRHVGAFFSFFQDMWDMVHFFRICGGICLTFFKISSHYLQLFCFTQHNSSITTSSLLSIFYLLFSPDLVFLLDLLFSLDLVLSLMLFFQVSVGPHYKTNKQTYFS